MSLGSAFRSRADSSRKEPAASWSNRSFSTCRRIASLGQFCARKDVLASAGRSSAASKSALISAHSALSIVLLQLSIQPGPGNTPVAFNRFLRNSQDLRNFFNAQTAKVAKFDDPALARVYL